MAGNIHDYKNIRNKFIEQFKTIFKDAAEKDLYDSLTLEVGKTLNAKNIKIDPNAIAKAIHESVNDAIRIALPKIKSHGIDLTEIITMDEKKLESKIKKLNKDISDGISTSKKDERSLIAYYESARLKGLKDIVNDKDIKNTYESLAKVKENFQYLVDFKKEIDNIIKGSNTVEENGVRAIENTINSILNDTNKISKIKEEVNKKLGSNISDVSIENKLISSSEAIAKIRGELKLTKAEAEKLVKTNFEKIGNRFQITEQSLDKLIAKTKEENGELAKLPNSGGDTSSKIDKETDSIENNTRAVDKNTSAKNVNAKASKEKAEDKPEKKREVAKAIQIETDALDKNTKAIEKNNQTQKEGVDTSKKNSLIKKNFDFLGKTTSEFLYNEDEQVKKHAELLDKYANTISQSEQEIKKATSKGGFQSIDVDDINELNGGLEKTAEMFDDISKKSGELKELPSFSSKNTDNIADSAKEETKQTEDVTKNIEKLISKNNAIDQIRESLSLTKKEAENLINTNFEKVGNKFQITKESLDALIESNKKVETVSDQVAQSQVDNSQKIVNAKEEEIKVEEQVTDSIRKESKQREYSFAELIDYYVRLKESINDLNKKSRRKETSISDEDRQETIDKLQKETKQYDLVKKELLKLFEKNGKYKASELVNFKSALEGFNVERVKKLYLGLKEVDNVAEDISEDLPKAGKSLSEDNNIASEKFVQQLENLSNILTTISDKLENLSKIEIDKTKFLSLEDVINRISDFLEISNSEYVNKVANDEITRLTELKTFITSELIPAIDSKTNAFINEDKTVAKSTSNELKKLKELKSVLTDIKDLAKIKLNISNVETSSNEKTVISKNEAKSKKVSRDKDLVGNIEFTSKDEAWSKLTTKLEQFDIETSNVVKVIRSLNKEGKESYKVFMKDGSSSVLGLNSDQILILNQEIVNVDKTLKDYRKTIDGIKSNANKIFNDKDVEISKKNLKDQIKLFSELDKQLDSYHNGDNKLVDESTYNSLKEYLNATMKDISSNIGAEFDKTELLSSEFFIGIIDGAKVAANNANAIIDDLNKKATNEVNTFKELTKLEKEIFTLEKKVAKDKSTEYDTNELNYLKGKKDALYKFVSDPASLTQKGKDELSKYEKLIKEKNEELEITKKSREEEKDRLAQEQTNAEAEKIKNELIKEEVKIYEEARRISEEIWKIEEKRITSKNGLNANDERDLKNLKEQKESLLEKELKTNEGYEARKNFYEVEKKHEKDIISLAEEQAQINLKNEKAQADAKAKKEAEIAIKKEEIKIAKEKAKAENENIKNLQRLTEIQKEKVRLSLKENSTSKDIADYKKLTREEKERLNTMKSMKNMTDNEKAALDKYIASIKESKNYFRDFVDEQDKAEKNTKLVDSYNKLAQLTKKISELENRDKLSASQKANLELIKDQYEVIYSLVGDITLETEEQIKAQNKFVAAQKEAEKYAKLTQENKRNSEVVKNYEALIKLNEKITNLKKRGVGEDDSDYKRVIDKRQELLTSVKNEINLNEEATDAKERYYKSLRYEAEMQKINAAKKQADIVASEAKKNAEKSEIDSTKEKIKTINSEAEAYERLIKIIEDITRLKEKEITSKNGLNTKDSTRLSELEEEKKKVSSVLKSQNVLTEEGIEARKKYNKVLIESREHIENIEKAQVETDRNNALEKAKKTVEEYNEDLSKLQDKFSKNEYIPSVGSRLTELETIIKEMNSLDVQKLGTEGYVDAVNELIDKAKELKSTLRMDKTTVFDGGSIQKSIGDISKFMEANSKMSASMKMQLSDLQNRFVDAYNTKKPITEVKKLEDEFSRLRAEVLTSGKTGRDMLSRLTQRLEDANARLLATYFSWQDWIRYARSAAETIRGLDDALVDLKKTTTMTNEELNQFYYNSSDIAKQMGVTTEEIISQAAAWSRLGYSSNEAATTMAQLSSKFASVSPGMNTDQAQEGLVSIMKAWDISTEDVERKIMDNINTLGNKFAETNADIITGMEKSAATFSALGQSVEDSFALFTGAQEIMQNAEVVGTALKTLSLRIRGYDEETEQLSDDLVTLKGDVIDLTKTASRPEGISLFTDASQTHYKSMVQYLGEISEIWDEIDEKSRTALLDKLFGKRGAKFSAYI